MAETAPSPEPRPAVQLARRLEPAGGTVRDRAPANCCQLSVHPPPTGPAPIGYPALPQSELGIPVPPHPPTPGHPVGGTARLRPVPRLRPRRFSRPRLHRLFRCTHRPRFRSRTRLPYRLSDGRRSRPIQPWPRPIRLPGPATEGASAPGHAHHCASGSHCDGPLAPGPALPRPIQAPVGAHSAPPQSACFPDPLAASPPSSLPNPGPATPLS